MTFLHLIAVVGHIVNRLIPGDLILGIIVGKIGVKRHIADGVLPGHGLHGLFDSLVELCCLIFGGGVGINREGIRRDHVAGLGVGLFDGKAGRRQRGGPTDSAGHPVQLGGEIVQCVVLDQCPFTAFQIVLFWRASRRAWALLAQIIALDRVLPVWVSVSYPVPSFASVLLA
nr:MAG TPA: hypothetical protein [Caudoviricetes sp.]